MSPKYVVVTAANGRSYYLAERVIGREGEYNVIATFLTDNTARKTAEMMNRSTTLAPRASSGKV